MNADRSVSIIIPVYNIERDLLTRCVESVVSQDYKNLEIILVDDGSTDGSGKVCDELAFIYGKNAAVGDPRDIKVIHKPNGGSSSARNAGIEASTGAYIGFVDCDDYVDTGFVSLMISAIERFDVPMAQISRDEIDADGRRLPDVCIPPKTEKVVTGEEQMRELLMHRGDCSFCTRLTDRRLFDGLKFPEGKLNEDFLLMIRMLPSVEKYVILPDQAYHVYYRIGSNSRSGDKEVFRTVFMDIVDNSDTAMKLVEERYPALKEEAARFAFRQRLDYLLHIPVGMMNKDNEFYRNVVKYLRKNTGSMICNRYLTGKNKLYLLLLSVAPKQVRQIHKKIRGID